MEHDISKATTSSMTGTVDNFSVQAKTPDAEGVKQKKTWYDYPEADRQLGYYKTIPELKKAIDALATWTCGKGIETDIGTKLILENLTGWGEDSFQAICWNLIVQKKIFGDAYCEIIRNDKGTLINIKPLYTGNMRVEVDEAGIIEQYVDKRTDEKFKPTDILHLVNDRVANEIHGISVIDAVKWVIDARNEAMADWRRISHRSTIRVMYIDVEDTTKLTHVKTEYATAIKNGELMLIPGNKKDVEFGELTLPPIDAFLRWIEYLENFFYQAVGIPRVIATSENYTEAASKVGYLTFEPIYTREQTELEADLWAQIALKVKFNRPPSLSGMLQQSEDKNTGQTGFQPNEMQASITKNE